MLTGFQDLDIQHPVWKLCRIFWSFTPRKLNIEQLPKPLTWFPSLVQSVRLWADSASVIVSLHFSGSHSFKTADHCNPAAIKILLIIIKYIYRCILVQKISNIDTIRQGRNIKLQLVKNMNWITAHHVRTQVPHHLWSHQHADALQVDRGRHIKYIWMEVVSVEIGLDLMAWMLRLWSNLEPAERLLCYLTHHNTTVTGSDGSVGIRGLFSPQSSLRVRVMCYIIMN